MTNALFVLVAFILLPALAISLLLRDAGRSFAGIRFATSALLLPPCVVGVSKLWIAPTSKMNMEFAFGAIVEHLPAVLLFLFSGIPGLLYKRRRSRGYLISVIVFGGLLTWLVTAGQVRAGAAAREVIPHIVSYIVTIVFAFAWASAVEKNRMGNQE